MPLLPVSYAPLLSYQVPDSTGVQRQDDKQYQQREININQSGNLVKTRLIAAR